MPAPDVAPGDGEGAEDVTEGVEVMADEHMAPFIHAAPQFGTMPQVGGPGTPGGQFPPGAGNPGGWGNGGGGNWGGAGGWGGRGGRGGRGQQAPALTQLQLIVLLDRGAMFGRININPRARTDESGWQSLLVAVKDLRPTPGASGLVRRVVLTGDKEASFTLEQIALVMETTRITASIRTANDPAGAQLTEVTVKPGRGTTLIADVESGTSDVDVTWNFDADNTGSYPAPLATAGGMPGAPTGMPPGMMPPGMMPPGMGAPAGMAPGATPPGMFPPGMEGQTGAAMVGPRIDARGLSARPDWPDEEQNYRVEITVRDRSGRKEEVKASLLVKVRS
jgi:hypothetical protein